MWLTKISLLTEQPSNNLNILATYAALGCSVTPAAAVVNC